MKSKDELTTLTNEVKALSEKLRELTPEELEFVSGGFKVSTNGEESAFRTFIDWLNKIS